jgi:Putative phage tail protein
VFIFMLLLFVATTVIGILMRPQNNGPLASSLGDFLYPTAQEGRPIPVVFGTVKIGGGNTVWWGDLTVQPIKQKSNPLLSLGLAGLFGGGGQAIGYKYFLGVQYVLCQGEVDALISIECDKKVLTFSSDVGSDPRVVYVNDPNIFGGTPDGQGGLEGEIDFYAGTQTQDGNAYLSRVQTATTLQETGDLPTFVGVGNGGLAFISPGPGSIDETITITATGDFYTNDKNQPYYLERQFIVEGSISGRISDNLGNNVAFENFAFGSDQINFTIMGGSIDFAPGDQWTIVTLAARVSPNYRGICYAVLNHFYVGVNSSPRAMAFVVQRCPDPLAMGASFANLNGDANGAFAVYDLLTNQRYGLGILPGRIDATAFEYAATILKNEGLGVSMLFDSQQTADQIIGEILRHIDGVLYVDLQTGLWTIKLARADYDISTVPEIDVDDVLSVQFARASWLETSNQVTLSYIDRANDFNTRTVKEEDNGNIAVTGEVRTENVTFNGLSNGATAALVASRCLMGFTYPISKVTLTVNRNAWQYRIGGVFKLTWVPLGVVGMVYRTIKISYGEVADGKITIDAIEDIFGLNFTIYDPPPASGWINPAGAPTAPAFQKLEEAPLQLSPTAGIYALTIVARAEGTDTAYEVFQPISGVDTETNEIPSFTPIGLLLGGYKAATGALDATGFKLQLFGIDLNLLVNTDAGGVLLGVNLALIDEELVSWETWTLNIDGTISIANVLRGVMDTVPRDHSSGAPVLFVTDGSGLTQQAPYPVDQTVQAKILPENNKGIFPLASASYITVVTRSRFARPYPPGNVCMQSQPYGVRYTTTLGDVVITWSSRNRITEAAAATLTRQDAGDLTPEAGTTYKVTVTIGGIIVRTVNPTTSPFSYTVADRLADGGAGAVTLDIFSNANSLDSYQSQEVTFEMSGFGLDFGNAFGGNQS